MKPRKPFAPREGSPKPARRVLAAPARQFHGELPVVVLHSGKEKSLHRRHPWVYATAIATVINASGEGPVEPASGAVVDVCDDQGRWLARGGYSPASSIRVRCLSFSPDQAVDAAFIGRLVLAAIERRADLRARTNALRLVFGEADGLPGLIIDQYAQWTVVQFLSAAMEAWRGVVLHTLREAGHHQLYERSDAATRQREGLASREGWIDPATDAVIARSVAPVAIQEDGVLGAVDIVSGHKTGAYIDQRDNRRLVGQLAAGRKVLNCFCYTGGFSHAALLGGASEVLSIDSSEPALEHGRDIEAMNRARQPSIPGRMQWQAANVFDALKTFAAERARFDMVILDPPKFAPSVQHLDRAARAYKEINLKALQLLNPGGLLFTFSCSGAVSVELFQKIIAGAVIDARVDMQLVSRLAAGEDHPMAMTHPEGEYLKGLLLRRV
jgi:23S rRNA (cytosine1962-C5)-methyltransferase